MGFPSSYADHLLPKLLLNSLTFLLTLLRSITQPDPDLQPEPVRPRSTSLSATLIREMLPVSVFSDAADPDLPESCAICLSEFEERDEIRRMRNCQHVFHRCCVDRWIDHDRKTCPLCRNPIVPYELQKDFNDKLWEASGILEFYSEYAPIDHFE